MSETSIKTHWKDRDNFSDSKIDETLLNNYQNHFENFSERVEISKSILFNLSNSLDDRLQFEDYYVSKLVDYQFPNKKHYDYFVNKTSAESYTKLKGYVTSIGEDSFSARLYEKNMEGTYENGVFDNTDVDEDDLKLFTDGAVFYWTFGHFKINGQIKKVSEIRFQRIANIDSVEFDEILDEVDDINDSLNWE